MPRKPRLVGGDESARNEISNLIAGMLRAVRGVHHIKTAVCCCRASFRKHENVIFRIEHRGLPCVLKHTDYGRSREGSNWGRRDGQQKIADS